MKYIVVISLICFMLAGFSFTACADVPKYTADQVIYVAKSCSPLCPPPPDRTFIFPEGTSRDEIDRVVESAYGTAVFTAEYLSEGVWLVTKHCQYKPRSQQEKPLRTEFAQQWHFHESNGKLVEIK